MRNIKLVLEYDGTNYHGFQKQTKSKIATVQGVLEEKISILTGENITVIGASRTDAGVHARGQVVNFMTECTIPTERMTAAINSVLPNDILILEAAEVPMNFHSRYNAWSKIYSYTILNQKLPSVFHRFYTWHVPEKLNIDSICRGLEIIKGKHDFSSFCASNTGVKDFVRNLKRAELEPEGPFLRFIFEADGFLYNMVRIIIGTLIEAGRGKITPKDINSILEAGDRTRAGPTAPPQGLCLEKVLYNGNA